MVRPLGMDSHLEYADAVLVGPGWGRGQDREALLQQIGSDPRRPMVLDADAIRLVAGNPLLREHLASPYALTPHPGELQALAGSLGISPVTPFIASLEQLTAQMDALIVAKSHTTWIRGYGSSHIWGGCTPELGTAGSGDVLAGLFAGLLARGLATAKAAGEKMQESPQEIKKIIEDTALAAVIAHGMAGRNLARTKGWFIASELVEECSRLIHAIDKSEGVV